ncbi:DUF58 domain-containing protein [Natronorubrum sp. JWXQ-INN-674]|uniref:DUF58 domain-containing protein n=1 Tax=Natronorubrum halalkaliphilum TaxID=2691917 RepID=A0A6B0VII9_9EURY|nr:DUF58 domain-containing protein [Natronorubrum halalkaliphilum]MXV61370.1 DUF58 domain-containing protein [Natronorubrum halalkaliphilum]
MSETSRQARWQAALVVALTSCLLAVGLGVPALFFLAIVALGFVLVGQASLTPDIERVVDAGGEATESERGAETESESNSESESETATATDAPVRLERTLEETRVRPGQSVTVTLSVTNEGSRVVPDVRIVDEPPADVPVTNGSPAFATAVSPGETVSHEYTLTPPRGEYEFGTATVRLRSLPATAVATAERVPAGDTEFACETLLDAFPFQDRTIQFVGQTPTDDGGSGTEFFSTREYRRGDPINRIDWHRFARTGDLATVEYREERSVTIVFVIDDRREHHRGVPGGGPDSFDFTLYAASRGVVASIEDGNRTGLATLSGDAWIEPGAGSEVRRRADSVLEDAAADSGTAADRSHPVADGGESGHANRTTSGNTLDDDSLAADLERRLPRRAQVAFCTPLLDDEAVDIVETLRTRGRAVTVISPDVTDGTETTAPSAGARIAGLRRANRIDALRGLGATVVDWTLAEPISVALAKSFRAGGAGGGSR